MWTEALLPGKNPGHHGVPRVARDPHTSLTALAERYFRRQVAGQAVGTQDAKRRDLACFLHFYTQLYGHDDAREWDTSVTEAFVKAPTEAQVTRPSKRGEPTPKRLSPSTISRTYATVRHFARWIHQHSAPFPFGCPIDGMKPPEEEASAWQGLSRADQLRFLNAAQTLRLRNGRGTNQDLGNHALVATLLGTALRISALLALDRTQVSGHGFVNVVRKGAHLQRFVPVQKQHREGLEAWLNERGETPGPLFPTRTGKALNRQEAFAILQCIAR
jgi:site-specific recombinase XerD